MPSLYALENVTGLNKPDSSRSGRGHAATRFERAIALIQLFSFQPLRSIR